MKRCPKCEFIYEDDQSLCDMDGVLLVLDSRTLPNPHALATVPPPKAQKRNRAVPAFATLVLALVLAMVYWVTTRQPAYAPPAPATLSAAPVTIPTPEPTVEPTPVKEEIKTETPREPTTASVKKPAAKTATSSQTKRTAQPKKDDSKVNSILKKTGRLLKKPFKKL